MSKHNKILQPEQRPMPVDARFSLANPLIKRSDDIIKDDYGVSIRILTYPSPLGEALRLRQALSANGVILGEQTQSQIHESDRFSIPPSSRPISYDSPKNRKGEYVYDDSLLFFDLGRLMRVIADAGDELPLVLKDEIGQNVATKGFTRQDEPKILLVPGFESVIQPVENDDVATRFYIHSLYHEFGQRFRPHINQFFEGFHNIGT